MLHLLRSLTDQKWPGAVVVVDGAGSAATQTIVTDSGADYLQNERGRGRQIAQGVRLAEAWILILHADSTVNLAMRDELVAVMDGLPAWGRFNVTIPGHRLIATSMNWRSSLTKICTGDQGMFFHRDLIDQFPDQPLMEDIELSRRLKRMHSERFQALRAYITTSPRRWRQRGVVRTVVTMWWYRLRYYFGTSANVLYAEYYRNHD